MRAQKGNWETIVREKINEAVKETFKKRKFSSGGEMYELDAAYPSMGEPIGIGIDVKRIEAQQDIHKRADEVINKAIKYKNAYPEGLFIAVIYFPFPSQHINLQNRLRHEAINHIFFAGESASSIQNCVEMMSGVLKPCIK